MNGRWRAACRYAVSDGVPRRSLTVAIRRKAIFT